MSCPLPPASVVSAPRSPHGLGRRKGQNLLLMAELATVASKMRKDVGRMSNHSMKCHFRYRENIRWRSYETDLRSSESLLPHCQGHLLFSMLQLVADIQQRRHLWWVQKPPWLLRQNPGRSAWLDCGHRARLSETFSGVKEI